MGNTRLQSIIEMVCQDVVWYAAVNLAYGNDSY